MGEQALADVKVLDLTHYIAGPYCTKLLADYGAVVIKVEKPGSGDLARRMGPFPNDEPHIEKSALFLHLNTNKKSITLNLKTPTGQKIIKELVKETDILVESFKPGTMARWGLDYETLAKINPQLVMGSISNFGQYGPYRDFEMSDILLNAMGGDMYATGTYDREPLKHAVNVVLYQAGSSAAVGIMGAWFGAKYLGMPGQQLDISLQETLEAGIDRRMTNLIAYQYTGLQHIRISESGTGFPSGVYPCKDGYFNVLSGIAWWPRIVKMLGDPELANPPWCTPEAQSDMQLKEEFETRWWWPWLSPKTKYEAWRAAQDVGVLSAPLNTTEDLLKDEHLKQRKFFVQVDHPVAGTVTYPGAVAIMAETPWQIKTPAPLLGQHNEEVYGQLGYTKQDLLLLHQQGVI